MRKNKRAITGEKILQQYAKPHRNPFDEDYNPFTEVRRPAEQGTPAEIILDSVAQAENLMRIAKAAALKLIPYKDYLKTAHWDETRAAALKRSEFACQLCKSTERLEVHHNTYERLGSELDSDLTVLCKRCHEKFHNIEKSEPKEMSLQELVEVVNADKKSRGLVSTEAHEMTPQEA